MVLLFCHVEECAMRNIKMQMIFIFFVLLSLLIGCNNTMQRQKQYIKPARIDSLEMSSLDNKMVIVDNGFAGNGFLFLKKGISYTVIRHIFGSGVPVIKKETFEAAVPTNNKIELKSENDVFIFILKDKHLHYYHNNIEFKIYAIENGNKWL